MLQNKTIFLKLLPAISITILLFVGGFLIGVAQSLGYFPAANQFHFSFLYYKQLFRSEDFWSSLGLSLRTAFLSSIFAGGLGMISSVGFFFMVKNRNRSQQFWEKMFQIPMVVPPLVTAFIIILLLERSGWLSRLLEAFGWLSQINQFPILVNDSFGWGIIFAYTWKEAAFVALMIFPILSRIPKDWLDVSRILGGNRWSFFRTVMFPLLMPAWLSAVFIVFAFTFTAFEVPFLLGVTYPKTLSVLSYNLFTSGGLDARPEALAINVILVWIIAIIGIIMYWFRRRWYLGEGGW
ncbi:ABC transporter permease [Radiobacillus deserti]|uniref:ABC transporter permease subunit n=1 Tax=Radiobacillus deserti TaxID=2594883 RepID=A0A516KIW7_9BACI|nr:ABC transporter permease subunit [Radiobacillus deserti]QDP41344.1 ABC transporter permease subunit [Radiobacillus deserti]